MSQDKAVYNKPVISVIGLGYVGLPLALAFGKQASVIGYDIDKEKIQSFKNGIDVINEVGDEALKDTSVTFTFDEKILQKCNFHIVTVPTPVDKNNTPDLKPLTTACEVLGRNLQKNVIVVFESTVFPGATEEICIPILQKTSGLKCGKDFKVGYSPERINPGDKEHRLENVVKIVSSIDEESLDYIAKTYEMILNNEVYKARSIKVAEAAKIIENVQRDVNIALINEFSMIFNKMGIDTYEVLETAATKWNFSKFYPGLVGGHCIGVDSYYFLSKAIEKRCFSNVIMSARNVNTAMGRYVADNIIKMLITAGKKPLNSKVMIMGVTFKENVSDIRNSGVISVINELNQYGINVAITDPLVDKKKLKEEYGIEIFDEDEVKDVDAIVVAVAHDNYKKINLRGLKRKYHEMPYVLIDIKRIFNKEQAQREGFLYFSL